MVNSTVPPLGTGGGAKILPNDTLGKKRLKGGEAYFSPSWFKYAYFCPYLTENLQNWKKEEKKRGWQIFNCVAHPLIIITFIWGKNGNQEGGGGQKIGIWHLIYTADQVRNVLLEESIATLLLPDLQVMIFIFCRFVSFLFFQELET